MTSAMNKRQMKKILKKQEEFVSAFCKSYRELKHTDRQYHEYVISQCRSKAKDDANGQAGFDD